MKNANIYTCLCYALALLFTLAFSIPSNGQKESFPDYFTYYNPVAPNVPAGSDTASKAIMFSVARTEITGNTGTLFLINTFRDDDTICACLTGHQMDAFFPNANVTPGPFSGNFDLYMNYRGKDSLAVINGVNYSLNRTIGFSKGVATGGELVAYYYDPLQPSVSPDIALILLDKRQLPVSSYATLGYDFGNSNWETEQYYSINHPHIWPQRIQDNLTFAWRGASRVEYTTSLPFSTGNGSSGGPLIKKTTGPGDEWYVRGLVSRGNGSSGGTVYDWLTDAHLNYFTHASFTKIATIATEIKRHCWKNRDTNDILNNGLHRRSVLVNNAANIAPFSQKRAISSAADVMAAAYSGPVKKRILSAYIPADQCNISAFTLPAVYPGSTDFWQVTVAAKDIIVGADFSYTPTDQSELNLSTVIIDGSAAGSLFRKGDSTPSVADKMPHKTADEFKVYPNPSPDGIFNLALPDTGQYSVAVYSMEGKKIYESNCTENPFRLQLPQTARGNYVLQVYAAGNKKAVYSQLIGY